jgi:hypothetical protein
MKLLAHAVAFSSEAGTAPPGFRPLAALPLVILVGLTGVGKSTILELLSQNGVAFTLLPNRREVTDEIIITSLQIEAGETPHPITDRVERFDYTARYRAKYPGGMAHALSQLTINPSQTKLLLMFDGLRGLEEVQHGATYFPQARFVVLDAPDTVRLNRLLQRGDLFDTTDTPVTASANLDDMISALQAIPHIKAVFSEEQLHQMVKRSQAGQVTPNELVQKLIIIVKERRNYDSRAARDYLTNILPPQRVLLVDTSQQPAQMVAQQIADWLMDIYA